MRLSGDDVPEDHMTNGRRVNAGSLLRPRYYRCRERRQGNLLQAASKGADGRPRRAHYVDLVCRHSGIRMVIEALVGVVFVKAVARLTGNRREDTPGCTWL